MARCAIRNVITIEMPPDFGVATSWEERELGTSMMRTLDSMIRVIRYARAINQIANDKWERNAFNVIEVSRN